MPELVHEPIIENFLGGIEYWINTRIVPVRRVGVFIEEDICTHTISTGVLRHGTDVPTTCVEASCLYDVDFPIVQPTLARHDPSKIRPKIGEPLPRSNFRSPRREDAQPHLDRG